MHDIFESCYENFLGFDLKDWHKKMSIHSEYHMINGRPLKIEDLDNQQVNFSDGLSSSFRLLNHKGRNYLLGENSCYPCSIVLKNNQGYKWVDLFIIPNGNEIVFSQKNSIIRYSFQNIFNAIKKITDLELLEKLLRNYIKSFQKNDWFSKLEIIHIIKSSSIKYKEMFETLYSKGLLNPFQLALSSIHFNFKISNKDLYNALLINNDIPLGIVYIVSPSYKIKFSKSTTSLISNEIFKEYIFSLDQSEIESFFEIDFIIDKIFSLNVYDDLILDVLSIDDLKRNNINNLGIAGWRYKIQIMEKVGITLELIKDYYSRLASNLRFIENTVRKNKGFNLVGSLYNESLLYKIISERFPEMTLFSQYSPNWLGRQRFDIFILELNLAIEYNGRQHYEPIDFYGGEEGFKRTINRDEEKRKKCKVNDCLLIEVKYDEEFEICLNKIQEVILFKNNN